MDIEKAKELIEENESDDSEKHAVMRGLQLLAKYEDDLIPEYDHDIIWASDFEETVVQMPEEEVVLLAKLGWFFDRNNDCWAHF